MDGLIKKGYEKPLEKEDLLPLEEQDFTDLCAANLSKCWQAELRKPSPNLGRAVLICWSRPILVGGVWTLLSGLAMLASPLLTKALIQFVQNRNGSPMFGMWLAVGVFVAGVVQSLCSNMQFFTMSRVGMQARAALTSLTYGKVLTVRSDVMVATTSGKVQNLLSTDVDRLLEIALSIHSGWSAPLFVSILMFFVFLEVGVAAVPGFVTMALLFLPQSRIAKRLGALRGLQTKAGDKRISLLSDFLNGIRVVKLNAWERYFASAIKARRAEETKLLLEADDERCVIVFLVNFSNVLASMVTLAAYSLSGGVMTPAKVFVTVSLFSAMRAPMTGLPAFVGYITQALVSLRRIQPFLAAPDAPPLPPRTAADAKLPPVLVSSASFAWDPSAALAASTPTKDNGRDHIPAPVIASSASDSDAESALRVPDRPSAAASGEGARGFVLRDISLDVKMGEFVAVVGRVGSGKSSLLAALLNDMPLIKGHVHVVPPIAYVPQQPWLLNASLRDNITFGAPFDPERYWRVVRCCCLDKDLESLPAADLTEIGERGVNLSGGQKQRVCVARAVYSGADVYLLDDPLSACDPTVARAIFNDCFLTFLRSKTRVLVTNQLHFLGDVDRVVVMSQGRIVQAASFSSCMASGGLLHVLHHSSPPATPAAQSAPTKLPPVDVSTEPEPLPLLGTVMEEVRESPAMQLIDAEERPKGSVPLNVWKSYLVAAGGLPSLTLVVSLASLGQLSQSATYLWLARWTSTPLTGSSPLSYMAVYAGLVLLSCICTIERLRATYRLCALASSRLHEQMFHRVMRAPLSFFERTPAGRIISRFSKDMDQTDKALPFQLDQTILTGFLIGGSLATLCLVVPQMLVPLVPLTYFFAQVQSYFRATSRELSRLETLSRSPITSLSAETLAGVSSIRAYNAAPAFMKRTNALLDQASNTYILQSAAFRWLGLRLDLLNSCILLAAACVCLALRNRLGAGLVAVCLINASQVSQALAWLVRVSTETEARMASVERICDYIDNVPVERAAIIDGQRPPSGWPEKGRIEFRDVVMRYREDLPAVLNGVSFDVQPGQKVGIVGRTGSGKSSLAATLFRAVELSGGSIVIDGIDIASIGLDDLRDRLSIIPQDPILFTGTVRYNLDPSATVSDAELQSALRRVHLLSAIDALEGGLDAQVGEAGSAFSQGQRQLLCLARALLRSSNIVVLDEATANIDVQTDALLQETVAHEFGNCTVLTIAHRINTVLNSDIILALDQGRVVDFGPPQELLKRPESAFAQLVRASQSSAPAPEPAVR